MKLFFLFLFSFFLCSQSFSQFSQAERAIIDIKNLYTNPAAEQGIRGWTETGGGAIALETTTKRSGRAAIKFTSSDTGDYLNFPTVVVKKGTNNCEASIYYKSTSSAFDLEVYVNAVKVALLDLPSNTEFTKAVLPFVCTDFANNTQVKITNGANNDVIYVDDAYIGANTNIGTVAQAEFVGSIKWTPTANCVWTAGPSGSDADFSSDADCDDNSRTLTGQATDTAAGLLPTITVPKKSGTYLVIANGSFGGASSDTSNGSGFKFTDGSTKFGENSVAHFYTTAGYGIMAGNISGRINYSTGGGTVSFTITTFNQSSSTTRKIWADGSGLEISVYYYPSASEQVVRAESANQFAAVRWVGDNSSTQDSTTSSTFETFSTAGFATRTNIGKAENPSSTNDLAMKVSNLPPGKYKVKAIGPLYASRDSVSDTDCDFAIYDGTSTYAKNKALASGAGSEIDTISHLEGTFEYSSLQSSITFYVQGARRTGGGTCWAGFYYDKTGFEISLEQVYPTAAMPQIINSVSTTYNGQTVLNSATIAGASASTACSASPCTTYYETGDWISSVTRSSTGIYVINFQSGVFTTAPSCQVVPQGGNEATYTAAASTSSVGFGNVTASTGGVVDSAFQVMCHGMK